MTNPLEEFSGSRGHTVGASVDDLRQWCEDTNAGRTPFVQSRWYYVSSDENGDRVITLEGIAAGEIRKTLKGWWPDYHGWHDARRDALGHALRKQARYGMTEETWLKWSAKNPPRHSAASTSQAA